MSVFTQIDFDDHEQVVFARDARAGLKAIIAVHNTARGPAMGGIRMYPYASEDDAIRDALRLSRGMTYKNALAELPIGGGKSVIIGDPHHDKTEALLLAMGEAIERLGGRYIGAEDSGTSVPDVKVMAQRTQHLSGIHEKSTTDGSTRSGDPSPATAYGCFVGLKEAVRHRLGSTELRGLRVAIQGTGSVGLRLGRHLKDAGAQLWVTDVFPANLDRAVTELGATAVAPEAIFDLDVDVFAPCALGAILNDDTIPRLKAAVVAGAANNQLAEARHGEALRARGILYAPDYAINAGGIIDVCYERIGFDATAVKAHVERIAATLATIFERAASEGVSTAVIADRLAEERFKR